MAEIGIPDFGTIDPSEGATPSAGGWEAECEGSAWSPETCPRTGNPNKAGAAGSSCAQAHTQEGGVTAPSSLLPQGVIDLISTAYDLGLEAGRNLAFQRLLEELNGKGSDG